MDSLSSIPLSSFRVEADIRPQSAGGSSKVFLAFIDTHCCIGNDFDFDCQRLPLPLFSTQTIITATRVGETEGEQQQQLYSNNNHNIIIDTQTTNAMMKQFDVTLLQFPISPN
jgi:hypothetical protein